MTDLEKLQQQRDQLRASRATGAERIRRGDNDTQFRSLKDVDAILADLDRQIAVLSGAKQPIKRLYFRGGKGL